MTQDDLERLPDRVDVVVVGLGLIGAAVTWALTCRGHEVVAVDANPAGHRRGSSYGSSRIFRRAYLERDYVAMSGRALELWRELEGAAGATLLTTTGGLDHGPGRAVRPLFEVLRASGVASELVSTAESGERWPYLKVEGEVVHQPQAGVIDPFGWRPAGWWRQGPGRLRCCGRSSTCRSRSPSSRSFTSRAATQVTSRPGRL